MAPIKTIKVKAKYSKSEHCWHATAAADNVEVSAEAAHAREAIEDALEYLFDLVGDRADLSPKDPEDDVLESIADHELDL